MQQASLKHCCRLAARRQSHLLPPPAPRRSTGAKLLKWPREQLDRWGGWFMFGLFAGGRRGRQCTQQRATGAAAGCASPPSAAALPAHTRPPLPCCPLIPPHPPTAILVWEEVWDLPHTAYLSGWLLLLITSGAVACSAVFERRMWCRYLCPIGVA